MFWDQADPYILPPFGDGLPPIQQHNRTLNQRTCRPEGSQHSPISTSRYTPRITLYCVNPVDQQRTDDMYTTQTLVMFSFGGIVF